MKRRVEVITRYHDMGCYLAATKPGAVDYLEKPLTAHEIIRVIATYLPSGNLSSTELDAGSVKRNQQV